MQRRSVNNQSAAVIMYQQKSAGWVSKFSFLGGMMGASAWVSLTGETGSRRRGEAACGRERE